MERHASAKEINGSTSNDLNEDFVGHLQDRFRVLLEGNEQVAQQKVETTIAALLAETVAALGSRLEVIESHVREVRSKLDNNVPRKEWYTVSEVAETLGRAEFTVREWCRIGRVYASKRACGRGPTQEWIIADTEIDRIRNEGLLPM